MNEPSVSCCALLGHGLMEGATQREAEVIRESVLDCIVLAQKSESPFPYPRLSVWLRNMGCLEARDRLGITAPMGSRLEYLRGHWLEAGSPETEWPPIFHREVCGADGKFDLLSWWMGIEASWVALTSELRNRQAEKPAEKKGSNE